jgi:hypothetical protein
MKTKGGVTKNKFIQTILMETIQSRGNKHNTSFYSLLMNELDKQMFVLGDPSQPSLM